ncbi:MAG TPA: cytochrome c3 family protein [Tepidisphaeraceae bacterium]|jgi:predicted CXXCH cytochrome family protein
MTGRVIGFLVVLSIADSAFAADAVKPATQVARPTERTKSCTDGGCHAEQTKYKVLHGPTALGACDACHTYVDEKQHTFKLRQTDKELCEFCHIGKITGKVVHKPVADAKCLSCHNPHGGATRLVLRKDTMAELCATCHDDVTKKRTHIHGPVAAGSCAACHDAHRSDHKKLLVAEGRELCTSCHDDMNKQLKEAKFVHKPAAEGDCQQCHEPHASDQVMQLKKAPAELCLSCHEKIKDRVEKATHKHPVVTEGAACLTCHTPHGGTLAKLQKDVPIKTCLTCHDKKIKDADGHVVAAVSELTSKNLYLHGPAKEGNCSGCHEVHGSDQTRLLAKSYPETFYTSFEIEKYDLCFSCHDKQLVQLKDTKGLTNFRNGSTNLHYAHVNKADKGRTCRACHETHASEQQFHIRNSVPYGKWELPINFKPSKSGGSCQPGCHKEYFYDRENPVARPAPPTSPTQPANVAASAAAGN